MSTPEPTPATDPPGAATAELPAEPFLAPQSRNLTAVATLRAAAAVTALFAGLAGLVNSAVGSQDLGLGVRETLSAALAAQRFTTALLAVGVCAIAPALWRGKRWAAYASLLLGALLVMAVTSSARPAIVAALLVLAAIVLFGRSSFAVRSDSFGVASTLRRCVVAEFVVLVYGAVGLFVLDAEFTTSTSIPRSLADGLRLLFLLPSTTAATTGTLGAHFIESVRLLSLVALSVTVISLLVPVVRRRPGADHSQAREIATAWGTNRLTHFTLWDDKVHTFDQSGRAMVSYHPHGRVAMALGGPVGPAADQGAAVAVFEAECARDGLIPAFHQVGESDRLVLEQSGYRLQRIGAEAIVDVQAFTLEGSHWKKMRSSLSILKRDGIVIEELTHSIDEATLDELEAVSLAWQESGGHRERTFTLGQFSRQYLQDTRVLIARRLDGRIEAFVNIVPQYASTVGTFDMMRRRPDSANGVMDGLFVAMIEAFRSEGLTGMNLGMAPLAQLPDDDLLDKGLNQLRERGNQFFNFQGLEAFKEKWRPDWEPRFVAYRNAAELPAVLRCVQTIGELDTEHDSHPIEAAQRIGRRFPVSLAVGGLTLWVMAATAIDPAFHQQMLDGFGLSLPELFDLDLWRPIASAFVQADPGFVIVNALLILTLLPAAEWLMGSRRTAAVFWLGHLLTLLPLLAVFDLLGELGDDGALQFATSPDAGSSAGLWALAGALAHRLPSRRWQFGAAAGLLGGHAIYGVLDRDPASIQHALAVLVGFGLVELMNRRAAGTLPFIAIGQRINGLIPTKLRTS